MTNDGHIAPRPFWQHPLCAAALLLLAAFAAGLFARHALDHGLAWQCAFLNLTGFPCPTCGATRTLAALAGLDFTRALQINPLLALGAVALTALPFAWNRLQTAPRGFWLCLAALALLNWAYLCLFLPR